MYTQEDFTNEYIYNYSENVSDFLQEFLEESNEPTTTEWSYSNQKIDNPKISFFEQRIAALEGGTDSLAVKSFNKAKFSVIQTLLQTGENIVTFNSHILYTKDKAKLNRWGIEVRLSEDGNLKTFEKLIDSNTKLIYLETISPEYLTIPDFQKIVRIAKEHNIPVLVDNTAGAAGYLTRPIKNGANILIERTKNWLPSHKELLGAVIVDGGNYNWQNGKFPQLLTPSTDENIQEIPSAFSIIEYIKKEGNINYTHYAIPEDPLSLIHDLENLSSLVQNQSNNALELALWLKEQDAVKEVNYTGFPSNQSYFNALTFFKNGFGSHLSFTLKNERESQRLFSYLKIEKSILKDHIAIESDTIHVNLPGLEFDTIKAAFLVSFYKLNQDKAAFYSEKLNPLNSLTTIF